MNRFFGKVADRIEKLDAGARRAQFKVLADEIEFFESVFRTMREGVIVADGAGALKFANDSAGSLAGFDVAAAKGKPLARILPGWDWEHLLAAPEDGADWNRNITREIALSYPEKRVLEIRAVPSAAGTVLLVRDVTRERANEADALESGKNDAVKELASGVAHEIGNPLNALALNLDMLAREFKREPDPARRERLLADIAVAKDEVKRIDAINRGFLAALRPVSPKLEPGSPADPLKDTLGEMKTQFEERRIRVTLDLPPALPPVLLDRAQMRQVFFNLVKNALEAMKDGGSLAIELASDDTTVSVSFRDSGAGMSEEALARLFEPYRTTKTSGNGLGLMICRRIVRAHGGEIDVESKEGDGTRFTVRIPRLEKRVRSLT